MCNNIHDMIFNTTQSNFSNTEGRPYFINTEKRKMVNSHERFLLKTLALTISINFEMFYIFD